MTHDEITNRLLERIATALEKIAGANEKPKAEVKVRPEATAIANKQKKSQIGGEVHQLIGGYIDAFRLRYGKNARPDVGGRVQGQMKALLKDHPVPRLLALIQAFCQMDDPWFVKKAHDFPTLYENLGKVQTALRNGTGRAEDVRYWEKVFGGEHGTGNVQKADGQITGELRGACLQGGESRTVLALPIADS